MDTIASRNAAADEMHLLLTSELEKFTDWVYDLAYRKGWNHGYWKQDTDMSFQTCQMRRKR